MRVEELQKALRRSPFEPFSLHMSDGSRCDVHHPDQVLLTQRAAYVGIGNGNGERVFQDTVICDLAHVTRLSPLRPDGNR